MNNDDYKSLSLLQQCLSINHINSNMVNDELNIYYKRHQRKAMIEILNVLKDSLTRVQINIYLETPHKTFHMAVLRKQDQPIKVSHKNFLIRY